MKILILISLDAYSYQSKQIRTPSSLLGVIVACPSRSNSSLPSILADTLPLGKHFFPFGFLISYAYDSSIGVVLSADIFTIQSMTTTVLLRSTLNHLKYLIFDSYNGARTISGEKGSLPKNGLTKT